VPTDEDSQGVDGFYGTPQRKRIRDYSRDGVRRSIEQTCERLGLDRVDVAVIHDPDDYWEVAIGEASPALEELRSEGTVAAIGVGINLAGMAERFVRESDLDCVLIAGCYSLIEDPATRGFFPACCEAGTAVLAAGRGPASTARRKAQRRRALRCYQLSNISPTVTPGPTVTIRPRSPGPGLRLLMVSART
jgi:D-threo-aldose 1-dehydrogenase